ncbi:MAG TPA: hypothetical protein VFP64_05095 [Pyrinomonadaceae bacterium]|nr:hypothetical protein [Pyrinomonadaceae bacterium]
MRLKLILLSAAVTLAVSTVAISQQPKQDKPISAAESEALQIEAAIKPYIEKARTTYPQAKARFLSGLPPKHTFFITTRLYDSLKRFEQVFVAVKEIKDGRISGVIATEIHLVSGYREGDAYSFPESELIDWTISKPDGTEEGNFVGNFLDSYQPPHVVGAGAWRNEPVTPARMNERIEAAAVQYAAHAPIPRIVLYDISYPNGEQEYTALDGNAVILFSAVSQNREELPLQRVYASVGGKEVELKLLKTVLAELPVNNSASTRTFGRFRADALYLLPLSLRGTSADIFVDFQQNRTAFKVATFNTPLPDELKRLNPIQPSGAGPSQSALETFIKREYPSFFQQ